MYVLRFLKPFDEGHFISKAKNYDLVMFLEDGVKKGGISEYLDSVIKSSPETHGLKTLVTAFPDSFVANGSRQQILESTGLSSGQITEKALSQLSDNR